MSERHTTSEAKRIRRRLFLHTLAAGAAAAALPKRARGAADRPPNLIVIMADDLGAKELGCYGHPEHKTPHLDQLSRTGVVFKTCFTAPICHPTRFEIMTGQYGCHNGVLHFAGRRGGPKPSDPAEQIVNHITFAQVLKPKGYATAHAGKWQLSGKVPTLVTETGFDEYCMWAYKNNLPPSVEHTGGWEGRVGGKTSRFWHPSIVQNGKYRPTKPDDYGPDIFTNFAIDFATRNKHKPFFIYYPMAFTHAPYYTTPDTTKSPDDRFKHLKANFQCNVEYMDKLVGRIVAAVEKLGLRDRTIIFFTGDNGTGGSGKGQVTELGARVPMIVNCPGTVKQRPPTDELVDTADVMPTLADFAGAAVPKDRPIDGRSIAPFLRGAADATKEWVFAYLADGRILRTKRWLLERNTPRRFGRLFDCGTSRDGTDYKDVTDSTAPEVAAIKKKFAAILAKLPAPDLPPPKPKDRPRRGKPKGKGARKTE
ncbi:MAG: sulfatase-like hydrolase/transferase [Candidatus Brocadiae bacterium]|nr:sulfatase-like hydrolase/transferase [Candidatus Brocadiia bacterium]